MKRLHRYLDVLLIVLLTALFIVPAALAQGNEPGQDLLAPFAPILAASLAIERLLQLVRNIISPNPEAGILARGSKALRYYTTLGGSALGLAVAFLSNLRLLDSAGITFDPTLDAILTGVALGMGTEIVHELIKVIAEGKSALRKASR